MQSFPHILFWMVALATASAGFGVTVASVPAFARRIAPLGGALLILVCLFLILPELGAEAGWAVALTGMTAGALLVWIVDRYIHPVCPASSHGHDHSGCGARLHGFAIPIVAAAAVHNLMDGWTLSLVQRDPIANVAMALPAVVAAVAIHKVPEGLALGVILRGALRSRVAAFGCAALTQAAMIAGAFAGHWITRSLSASWLTAIVAVSTGSLLYLGGHALRGEPSVRAFGAPVVRFFSKLRV